MEIRPLSAMPAALRIGRVPGLEPTQPLTARAEAASSPPVPQTGTVEAPQEAPSAPHDTRYVRDDVTNRMVLSVVDPGTGDVIAQLPTKAALRAQAYAAEIAARSAPRPSLARLA